MQAADRAGADDDDVVVLADPGELLAVETQANGSATEASAKETLSGMRFSPSTASTARGTIMYSAKPPSYW